MSYSKELFDAVVEKNVEKVRAVITSGADVNALSEEGDYKGAPPLLAAILVNPSNGDIITELVNAGADKNRVDDPAVGFTSLHHAANLGIPIAAKALLLLGADPNISDVAGRTPVHYAGTKCFKNLCETLVLGGADPTIKATIDGHTMATYAAMEGGVEIGSDLHQLELDYTENRDLFSFFKSITVDDLPGINNAIEKGLHTAVSKTGWTPLMVSLKMGRKETAERLITLGVDVNAVHSNGVTSALFFAVTQNYKEIFDSLLSYGVNVNVQDVGGNSFLSNTILNSSDENTHYYIEKILASCSDINAANSYGESALYMASQGKDVEIVQMLLDKGADIHAKTSEGGTVLHSAARSTNPEIIAFLISKGADINAAMGDGWQPIHISCEAENIDTLKKFVELGANKDAKTNDGQTPLDIATESGFDELVEFLSTK